jgi:heptaprenyl diphosphate synthase
VSKRLTPSATKRTEVIALLAAIALFLSSIEYIIPKPLPFLRLGIANLPILLSLYLLRPKEVVLLLALKIIVQAFIYGTLFSYIFIFSCAGGIASGLSMIGLHGIMRQRITLVGISAAGAFASNMVQLAVASVIIWGPGVFIIAPPFLLVGTVSACALGFLAEAFYRKSRWVKMIAG